jgi:N-acetylmuramoyl-L-alanine amidase
MAAFIIYLIKCILCSGLLYSLYRIAYYNRQHLRWSRAFLLGTVVVSLVLPLIEIDVPVATRENPSTVIKLLNVVSTDKTEVNDSIAAVNNSFDAGLLLTVMYACISAAFLFIMIRSIITIQKIYYSYPKEQINNIETVMTREKNTPFSFFRTIFWNTDIDHHSGIGKKIFEHEQAHVEQLHSIDRVLMNTVLIVFWCNPFYWLIKKELIVLHEFMADRSAVKDRNPETLSEMLLLSAFPGGNFGMTSSFFNSSIKRRSFMLTKHNNQKANLLGRWMLLPVMLLMIAGFTLRKTQVINGPESPFLVVIDAGHGGERSGVTASDGTTEKDLNLMIAKKIKDLNTDGNIKIVMTRENDVETPLPERVAIANNAKADAFISIHINRDETGKSGFQFYMTKNSNDFAAKSQILGTLLSQELGKVYQIDGELRKGRPDKNIFVLDAPEISYPSLLIECGNLLNSTDLAFVKSEENQKKIALHILNAIKQFVVNKASFTPQRQPSAVELLVEKGTIDFDIRDNKVARSDFSGLKMASARNIFPEDDYQADVSAVVIVDGTYLGDKSDDAKHLSIGENKKLILVSTTNRNPLETLKN